MSTKKKKLFGAAFH